MANVACIVAFIVGLKRLFKSKIFFPSGSPSMPQGGSSSGNPEVPPFKMANMLSCRASMPTCGVVCGARFGPRSPSDRLSHSGHSGVLSPCLYMPFVGLSCGGNPGCYHLSMRTNCCTIQTAVCADWSGVVFPTMCVLSMTLVSVKAQAAFPLLNPSTLLGHSIRTIGIVSLPLGCPVIPIPRSLALGQRSSPTLRSLVYQIPCPSSYLSVLTRPLWQR